MCWFKWEMHSHGHCHCSAIHVSSSVVTMFIGFLSYTNDAVINEMKEADLSVLEESVLEDLDLKGADSS